MTVERAKLMKMLQNKQIFTIERFSSGNRWLFQDHMISHSKAKRGLGNDGGCGLKINAFLFKDNKE
jgi:hypothetical protein